LGGLGASTNNAASSETVKTVESCNNFNIAPEKVQEIGKNIEDFTGQTCVKDSGPSQDVPNVPNPPTMNNSSLQSFDFIDPVYGTSEEGTITNDTISTQSECSQSAQYEDPKFHNLPEMPGESEEDDLEVVSENELVYLQQPSKKSFNPIISIEDFFSNDMPLPGHSVEESPCGPMIRTKPGDTPTETIYYCKLHPDLGSIFLSQIEIHCRKESDIHKSEIIRLLKSEGGDNR
jgi:hypothetical protein